MLANLEEIAEAINAQDMANLLSWYRKVGFCRLPGFQVFFLVLNLLRLFIPHFHGRTKFL
ncbi:MAG: hypothetical protein KA138_16180 [Saprospiraceae bacterium]|nr:hypothetical protein [Saprospiraceae bacterium]